MSDQDDNSVIVSLGDMSRVVIEQVSLDDDYESMVEDFIGTFNHAVIQGVSPIKALLSFSSALAIVLGCAVRAGLRPVVGAKLIAMIVKNADVSSKMVKVLPERKPQ